MALEHVRRRRVVQPEDVVVDLIAAVSGQWEVVVTEAAGPDAELSGGRRGEDQGAQGQEDGCEFEGCHANSFFE